MADDLCARNSPDNKPVTIAQLQAKVDLHQIKGFLADDEAACLFAFATRTSSLGPCLEVGSYCGKSSIYLGTGCKLGGTVLFALDHHRGSEEHQLGEQYHDADLYDPQAQVVDSFPAFRRNIELFGLTDTVIPVVASSELVVEVWTAPLGMVFIDGGHSHEASIRDCVRWSRHLAPGGVLAIHDVFENPADGGQGPFMGLQAVLEQGQYQRLQQVRSLAVLKRCA